MHNIKCVSSEPAPLSVHKAMCLKSFSIRTDEKVNRKVDSNKTPSRGSEAKGVRRGKEVSCNYFCKCGNLATGRVNP